MRRIDLTALVMSRSRRTRFNPRLKRRAMRPSFADFILPMQPQVSYLTSILAVLKGKRCLAISCLCKLSPINSSWFLWRLSAPSSLVSSVSSTSYTSKALLTRDAFCASAVCLRTIMPPRRNKTAYRAPMSLMTAIMVVMIVLWKLTLE